MGFSQNQVAPGRSMHLLGLNTGHKIQQHTAVRKVENFGSQEPPECRPTLPQVRMSPLCITGSSTLPVQHLHHQLCDKLAASALADQSASDSWPYSKWLIPAEGLGERKQWTEDSFLAIWMESEKGTSKDTPEHGLPMARWWETPVRAANFQFFFSDRPLCAAN